MPERARHDNCFHGMEKIGPYDQDDDQAVRRVIAGEIDAFEGPVARHGPLVTAMVKRHVPFGDVEDTIQDGQKNKLHELRERMERHGRPGPPFP